jgi:hypothetical protein
MKKSVLLIIALTLYSLTLTAQTTFVPDDNFEQALIDLGYDNILDNQVLTQNISGISVLDIQFKAISDLTGLEDFESLTVLLCDYNEFTSISFHPNVNLSTFICQHNALTEIDLSQHTNLISFACTSNNLTSLDLSSNINLDTLIAGGNPFSELDLSGNPNLTEFDLNQTNHSIELLDVRNGNNANLMYFSVFDSPNLPFILVDDCAYSTTNWTVIDPISVFIEVEGQTECLLSINDNFNNSNINVYPNPVEGILTINNINTINVEKIDIFSVSGQKVKTTTSEFDKIDFQSFESGIYFLYIQSDKQVLNRVVIKQ